VRDKKFFIYLLLLLILSYNTVYAASFTKDEIGTTSAAFLKLGKGIRAVGMGEAYAGVPGSIESVYLNPAGLGKIRDAEICGMHSVWFQNIYFDNLSAVYPSLSGIYGLSVNYLSMKPIDKYYNTGAAAEDTYRPYDLAVYFSYANRYKNNLFGVNVKGIRSDIDGDAAQAVAADAGYAREFSENSLSFGIALQNMGTKLKYREEEDPLPFNIKTGAAYSGLIKSLLIAADVNFPVDNIPSYHFGAEYRYKIKQIELAVRAGYKTKTIEDLDALSGMSAGGGIGYKGLSVNYAWVPYGDLGNTHRMSLSYKLPAKPLEERAEEHEVRLKKKYFMKGHELFGEEKYQEASKQFKKVLAIDPGHGETIKYVREIEKILEKKEKETQKAEALTKPVKEEKDRNRIGLSLNYPGLGLRYFFGDKYYMEGKAQISDGVTALGLRGIQYINPRDKLKLLWGTELGFVLYEGEESEGRGYVFEVFGGGEYMFSEDFSFNMDFGPALILLQDKNYDVSTFGLEYVVNFGINRYFYGKSPSREAQ